MPTLNVALEVIILLCGLSGFLPVQIFQAVAPHLGHVDCRAVLWLVYRYAKRTKFLSYRLRRCARKQEKTNCFRSTINVPNLKALHNEEIQIKKWDYYFLEVLTLSFQLRGRMLKIIKINLIKSSLGKWNSSLILITI